MTSRNLFFSAIVFSLLLFFIVDGNNLSIAQEMRIYATFSERIQYEFLSAIYEASLFLFCRQQILDEELTLSRIQRHLLMDDTAIIITPI